MIINESRKIPKGRRIDYEDDIVIVYDTSRNNEVVYKGLEDYEPMNREDWKYDRDKGYYIFDKFIKVCVGEYL